MKNGAKLDGLIGPNSDDPSERAMPNAPASPPRQSAPGATGGDRPGWIVGVLTDAGVPQDQIGVLAGRFASALKVDPNAPLTAASRQVADHPGKFAPAQTQAASSPPQSTPAQRVSQGFDFAGGSDAASSAPPSARPPAQVAGTARSLNLAPQAATAIESRLDAMPVGQRKAYSNQLATSPAFPKSVNEWAEKRLESIERGEDPTTEVKNAEYDADNKGVLTRHKRRWHARKRQRRRLMKLPKLPCVKAAGRSRSNQTNRSDWQSGQSSPCRHVIWSTGRTGYAPSCHWTNPPAAKRLPTSGGAECRTCTTAGRSKCLHPSNGKQSRWQRRVDCHAVDRDAAENGGSKLRKGARELRRFAGRAEPACHNGGLGARFEQSGLVDHRHWRECPTGLGKDGQLAVAERRRERSEFAFRSECRRELGEAAKRNYAARIFAGPNVGRSRSDANRARRNRGEPEC